MGLFRAPRLQNQFGGGLAGFHIEMPLQAGRSLRRIHASAAGHGQGDWQQKESGRPRWRNEYVPINELRSGRLCADGFGKDIEGTLTGQIGNGIAAHHNTGFVFDAAYAIRKETGRFRPSTGSIGATILRMGADGVTSINAPIRIGRAVVLRVTWCWPRTDGVMFIPAILAEEGSARRNSLR